MLYALATLRFGIASPSAQHCSSEELQALKASGVLATGPASSEKSILPPGNFFLKTCVWALFFAHFAQNWQASLADWYPTLYRSSLSVSAETASMHLAAVAMVELPARAYTKDLPKRLIGGGWSLLACRRWMSVTGFAMHTAAMVCLGVLFSSRSYAPLVGAGPGAFTVILCLGKISQSMHAGGYFANYFDLTQKYAGALTGVGNTLATLAGLLLPRFASRLVDTDGGWMRLLSLVAGTNLLAIAAIAYLSVEPLDDREENEGSSKLHSGFELAQLRQKGIWATSLAALRQRQKVLDATRAS